jgi:hypothetical protein
MALPAVMLAAIAAGTLITASPMATVDTTAAAMAAGTVVVMAEAVTEGAAAATKVRRPERSRGTTGSYLGAKR